MPQCTGCNVDKPVDGFYLRHDRPCGHTSRCKACTLEKNKQHQHERDCPGTSSWERRRDYYAAYYGSGRHKEKNRIRYRQLKDEVIARYGGKCVRCGFDDVRALQLDHVHGDGCKERKQIRSATLLRRIIKEQFPPRYQLLCANCNTIKMYENKEFPGWRTHERGKV